jgi:hypothetical protein
MLFALLFLFGTASVLATTNDPILVCNGKKCKELNLEINYTIFLAPCTCSTQNDNEYLNIVCFNWSNLNTTNIIVPDSLLKNVSSVHFICFNFEIPKLTKPFLSDQLRELVVELQINGEQLLGIDAGSFDGLTKLEKLILTQNIINEDLLSNTYVESNLINLIN